MGHFFPEAECVFYFKAVNFALMSDETFIHTENQHQTKIQSTLSVKNMQQTVYGLLIFDYAFDGQYSIT